MLRFLTIFVLLLFFSESLFCQEVSAVYNIQPGSAANEYTIKTTISGLIGVDIARIKYLINNEHTYQPSPNNQLFSDRNENYIKFYIMAIPTNGIINVELGIVLGGNGEYAFPIELQYSRNEEKKVLNLPEIILKGNGILATVETPKPTSLPLVKKELNAEVTAPVPPIEKEEPIVETQIPLPIVEEKPVAKDSEPELSIVKEEPVEEVTKTEPLVVNEKPKVEHPKPTLPIVKEKPTPSIANKVTTKYTVQLLSLLEFSETRVNSFCKQHHIPLDKIMKIKKGEWMKITYGEANSKEEASQLLEKLKQEHQIKEAFIVPLN
ncbi:MAG: hypothetical protein CO118_08565 [Flavobacteriales bacterium CG_4_9_14_3_um_filter_32_8]|nr:MAG: hypothetical protein CO118_08565 [Flavobacteriales bacterium CG_4_9_14_3_um_filter_32_8]